MHTVKRINFIWIIIFWACAEAPLSDMKSAEKAIAAMRASRAEVYCKLELQQVMNAYNDAGNRLVARDFRAAKAFAVLAKELADSTLVLADAKEKHAKAEAEKSLENCERKLTTLQNLLIGFETVTIPSEAVSGASERYSELERDLLELMDKNSSGEYQEVIERSRYLIESASLATYELIKILGEQRKLARLKT
jgi:hypothetical protein